MKRGNPVFGASCILQTRLNIKKTNSTWDPIWMNFNRNFTNSLRKLVKPKIGENTLSSVPLPKKYKEISIDSILF